MTPVQSADGSCTAYSEAYGEHYHSTREGALRETLFKHVMPALHHFDTAPSLRILDICFGLGFNTLTTLLQLQDSGKHVEIVSPELDRALVESLADFDYPAHFAPLRPVITAIAATGRYEDERTRVEVLFGDARAVLPTLNTPFNVVYQDPFSLKCNPALWTLEYFAQIARLTHDRSLVTTYSTALKVRLALEANGFGVYLNADEDFRPATLACKTPLNYPAVNMAHKRACNPDVNALRDGDI